MLNFLFCPCIIFLILLKFLSVFSYSSMSFPKTAIMIFYHTNCRPPFLEGQFLENYCVLLVLSCLLNFFLFLEVLCCCPCISRSNHLLQYLLALGKKYLQKSFLLTTVGLLRSLLWVCLLHISCSFFGRNSYNFMTQSWKTRLSADNFVFAFPRAVSWNAQICVLSPNPAELGQLSSHALHLQWLLLAAHMGTDR